MVRRLAEERRRPAPASPHEQCGDVPEVVDRVVRCCLEPSRPRYQKADSLARALDGCRELRQIEDFPRPRTLTRLCLKCPVWMFVALGFIHLIGSAGEHCLQRRPHRGRPVAVAAPGFNEVVLVYNALVYPVCLSMVLATSAVPIFRMLTRLGGPERVDRQR